MKQFTCLNCGKTDSSVQGNKQFCDRQCWRQYYRKSGTIPRADIQLCLHNSGIECSGGDCSTCGWHPDVAAARKAELVGDDAKSLLAPGDVVYTTNGREIIQAKIINILADHLLTDVDCLFYDEHGTTWWLTQRVAKEKINNG